MASLPNGEGLKAAAQWLAYDAALRGLDVADAAKVLVSNFGEWIRPYTDQIVEGAKAFHPTVQKDLKEKFGVTLGEFGSRADDEEYRMDGPEESQLRQTRQYLQDAFQAQTVKLAAPAKRPRRVRDDVTPLVQDPAPASEVLESPKVAHTQVEADASVEVVQQKAPIKVPRYETPAWEEIPLQRPQHTLQATPGTIPQNKVTVVERLKSMPPGTKYAGVLFAILLIVITIAPPIGEPATYGRCVFTGYHFLFTPPNHYSSFLVLDTHRIILEIILAAAISFVFGVILSLKYSKTSHP